MVVILEYIIMGLMFIFALPLAGFTPLFLIWAGMKLGDTVYTVIASIFNLNMERINDNRNY